MTVRVSLFYYKMYIRVVYYTVYCVTVPRTREALRTRVYVIALIYCQRIYNS